MKDAPKELQSLSRVLEEADKLEGSETLREKTRDWLKIQTGKAVGALSGDLFDRKAFNYFKELKPTDDTILLTINGIRNTDSDAKDMLASIKTWNLGAQAKDYIQNGTHGLLGLTKFGAGDFFQIGVNELGARDLVAIRAAVQIELAAIALRAQQDLNPMMKSPTIIVVAHSQGTGSAHLIFRQEA